MRSAVNRQAVRLALFLRMTLAKITTALGGYMAALPSGLFYVIASYVRIRPVMQRLPNPLQHIAYVGAPAVLCVGIRSL
jgi:hypothetical protein